MSNLVSLLPKLQGETVPRIADFISKLPPGVLITSAACVAGVYSGNDASPQNIIVGLPTINGTVVTAKITAGVAGTIYALIYTAFGNDGNAYQLAGYLAVLGNPPPAPGSNFILLPGGQTVNLPSGAGVTIP